MTDYSVLKTSKKLAAMKEKSAGDEVEEKDEDEDDET